LLRTRALQHEQDPNTEQLKSTDPLLQTILNVCNDLLVN
jgi:hypothetical protein